MKAYLENYIRANTKNPAEAEIQAILALFEERQYSKGEPFKLPNTLVSEVGFITEGSTRSFVVRENGDEITGQITPKDNFVTDMISIRSGEPTPIGVEFIEKSSILVAQVADAQELLESNLAFNILIRKHIADRTVELAKRQMMFLTGTAKERYQFLLESNPSLLKKIPLRFIASMIGITPTQLSRIRKKK